jgi:hypothetical protein
MLQGVDECCGCRPATCIRTGKFFDNGGSVRRAITEQNHDDAGSRCRDLRWNKFPSTTFVITVTVSTAMTFIQSLMLL